MEVLEGSDYVCCCMKTSCMKVSRLTRWSTVVLPLRKPLRMGLDRLFDSRNHTKLVLTILAIIIMAFSVENNTHHAYNEGYGSHNAASVVEI